LYEFSEFLPRVLKLDSRQAMIACVEKESYEIQPKAFPVNPKDDDPDAISYYRILKAFYSFFTRAPGMGLGNSKVLEPEHHVALFRPVAERLVELGELDECILRLWPAKDRAGCEYCRSHKLGFLKLVKDTLDDRTLQGQGWESATVFECLYCGASWVNYMHGGLGRGWQRWTMEQGDEAGAG